MRVSKEPWGLEATYEESKREVPLNLALHALQRLEATYEESKREEDGRRAPKGLQFGSYL